MKWFLRPGITPGHLGFLPSFLSDEDIRPAKEQIDQNYAHGGGWLSLHGHTLENGHILKFPGDPPQLPLAWTTLRDEMILFYPHDFVVILQKDGSFEVSRID